MGDPMSWPFRLGLLLLLVVAPGWLSGAAAAEPAGNKKAFMVTDYRYEPPAGAAVNTDIGLSLCGTRCNALSGDFANYLKPGGWRLVKVASGVEVRVELNNPFLAGQCVCVGDDYQVDWFDPATYVDRPETSSTPRE